MKFLAVIPARGGSKGIPRKNIKLLKGKPLIWYSIVAALESKYINKVVLSTEDKEIAQVAKDCGAQVVWRPNELAQDETKTAPVLIDVINQLEKEKDHFYHYFHPNKEKKIHQSNLPQIQIIQII